MEKLHGERTPEDVRRYELALQAWRDGQGLGRCTRDDVDRVEARQALVVRPDEDPPQLMMDQATSQ